MAKCDTQSGEVNHSGGFAFLLEIRLGREAQFRARSTRALAHKDVHADYAATKRCVRAVDDETCAWHPSAVLAKEQARADACSIFLGDR